MGEGDVWGKRGEWRSCTLQVFLINFLNFEDAVASFYSVERMVHRSKETDKGTA